MYVDCLWNMLNSRLNSYCVIKIRKEKCEKSRRLTYAIKKNEILDSIPLPIRTRIFIVFRDGGFWKLLIKILERLYGLLHPIDWGRNEIKFKIINVAMLQENSKIIIIYCNTNPCPTMKCSPQQKTNHNQSMIIMIIIHSNIGTFFYCHYRYDVIICTMTDFRHM